MIKNKKKITVAIEWDNAGDVSSERSEQSLLSLRDRLIEAREIVELPIRVLLIFDQDEASESDIQNLIDITLGKNPDLIKPELHPVQEMRYYELKNYAARITNTDILVLYDSDLDAEPGWLPTLLAPMDNPDVQVVNGVAYMELSDFTSRTFALSWIFPTIFDSRGTRLDSRFNCNSTAIRTSIIQKIPLPNHPHYRVQCTFWSDVIRKEGIKIHKVEANAEHPPPRGILNIAMRALLQGRDNDTRHGVRKTKNRLYRLASAAERFLRLSSKAIKRGLKYGRKFGLKIHEIPFAIILGISYNFIVFISQSYFSLFGTVIPPDFTNSGIVKVQTD